MLAASVRNATRRALRRHAPGVGASLTITFEAPAPWLPPPSLLGHGRSWLHSTPLAAWPSDGPLVGGTSGTAGADDAGNAETAANGSVTDADGKRLTIEDLGLNEDGELGELEELEGISIDELNAVLGEEAVTAADADADADASEESDVLSDDVLFAAIDQGTGRGEARGGEDGGRSSGGQRGGSFGMSPEVSGSGFSCYQAAPRIRLPGTARPSGASA